MLEYKKRCKGEPGAVPQAVSHVLKAEGDDDDDGEN